MFADLPADLISENTGPKLTGDVLKLELGQRVIHTAQCHQLLMCTQFFHLAIFKHQYTVCCLDRLQAMGDQNGSAALHEVLKRFLNQLFGFCINRTGRLIKDQNFWV